MAIMAPSIPAPAIDANGKREAVFDLMRRVALPNQPSPNSEVLQKRQSSGGGGDFLLPTTYQGIQNAEDPGTVVGITLGVVLGVVFVLSMIYWGMSQNQEGYIADETLGVREVPRRRSSHRHSGTEIRRVSPRRRSYSPRRRSQVVEERTVEEFVRASPPPVREVREEVIIEPPRRRHRDEEEVIVYEESESTEPVKRRRSRGDHPRRPVSRRYS